MTNWDNRAEELAQKEARDLERHHNDLMAWHYAMRQRAEAVRNELLDVTSWAVRRYETASISPLLIYIKWEEEVKRLFGGSAKRGRRRQIDRLYPLRRYYTDHEGGEMSGSYKTYYMWAATKNCEIYEICLGTDRKYGANYDLTSYENISEITCEKRNETGWQEQLGSYFGQIAPPLSQKKESGSYAEYGLSSSSIDDRIHFPGNYSKSIELDVTCDEIVEYVSFHADPKRSPVGF